uniref:Uncharacterized protein n=1 Tax=Candidatus Methanogaster sp. ANME-2c ERB4 TaxID=2759911 RepID=A0A7G9Y596_9EURY|nr:hypothetical protein LDHBDEKG_00002 [Methanosarcinales archaeon ANME-2c ERB4]QNO43055.1 hypothetical protein HGKCJMEE_00033 [Methanosarcinales archaeon ANME-2c ERB4]QNO43180.1 hypothetical protein CEGDBGHB_00002 [Methanosarcinales archaeon ANME-2c ERB4]QNO45351.1 hypothetical protein IOFJOFCH_00011 [Methanosarcinales archaeon ANME-2c ERB4]QNO45681.1 hypothetical protein BOCBCOEP_00010 [Methanosarcinales archaeon ANME-2c ERB4]
MYIFQKDRRCVLQYFLKWVLFSHHRGDLLSIRLRKDRSEDNVRPRLLNNRWDHRIHQTINHPVMMPLYIPHPLLHEIHRLDCAVDECGAIEIAKPHDEFARDRCGVVGPEIVAVLVDEVDPGQEREHEPSERRYCVAAAAEFFDQVHP